MAERAPAAVPVGRLHVITDTRNGRDPLPDVAAVLSAGGRWIQVRGKELTDRALWDLARRVVNLAAPFGAVVVVDDRYDVALASGAAGVHLGAEDLPVSAVRGALGPGWVVGATVRNPEQARAAAAAGATYLGAGPVFPTRTKIGLPDPLGLPALAAVVSGTDLPVIAIGGVEPGNVGEVLGHGAHGVAVVSEVSAAADPFAAAAALLRAVGGA